MPSRYRRDTPRLKSEIVARVAEGERLAAVCAGSGMPGRQTVRNWARADAVFGAELARAEARGAFLRARFDEPVAAAFLARARAGETIHSLLRAPGMPSRRTYERWRMIEPPFAEAIWALRLRRDSQLGERGRARLRTFDPALADRIVVRLHHGERMDDILAADPELPSRPTVRRWRREQPSFDRVVRAILRAWRAKRGPTRGLTPDIEDAVFNALIAGGSFRSLGDDPAMPSRQTLRRWFAASPDFARTVTQACGFREEALVDRILDLSDGALRPDMYLNATLYCPLGRHLAIPTAALVDTGTRQLVYIETAPGRFEPRQIRVGRQAGREYGL